MTPILHVLANGGAGGTNLDPIYGKVMFWILAVLAVSAALAMILVRQAVHCALMLAVVMLSLAVMYAMQGAPFLAFVQVIVYTGAVLMLFLFVLMIVGVTSADALVETIRGQRVWAVLLAIGLLVMLLLVIGHAAIGPAAAQSSANFGTSNISGLAELIFTKYVFPFEVTSALLITAALGAMVLAFSRGTAKRRSQKELVEARFRGEYERISPKPGPGVFATSHSVATPALLPDGSIAAESLSAIIESTPTAQLEAERRVIEGTEPHPDAHALVGKEEEK